VIENKREEEREEERENEREKMQGTETFF